jgi:hypothetical protein
MATWTRSGATTAPGPHVPHTLKIETVGSTAAPRPVDASHTSRTGWPAWSLEGQVRHGGVVARIRQRHLGQGAHRAALRGGGHAPC